MDEKKIIIKKYSPMYQGSSFCWNMNTVRVLSGIVTDPIVLYKGKYYIGVNIPLLRGDIALIGRFTCEYRIVSSKVIVNRSKIMYQIKRIDGKPMTTADILNSKKANISIKGVTRNEVLDLMNNLEINQK